MRILKLELEAFGPFKDHEEIDFNLFKEDRIFLIGGKTGSGKTTIFDAISYALFGQMTGEFRDDSTARSQYAAKDKTTYVRLTFSKDDKIYSIYRKPSYILEGRKSASRPEICFKEITDGKDLVLSIKIADANSKIIDVIGFKYDQFKQIVVLPQGQFIKILNAKSKEREELLSAILDTSLYSSITDNLKDKSNTLRGRIDEVKIKTDAILNEFKVNNIDELMEIKKDASNTLATTKICLDSRKEEANKLDKEITRIDNNNKNINELNNYKASLNTLIQANLDIDNIKNYYKLLKDIKDIKPIYDNLSLRKRDLNDNQASLNNNRLELDAIIPLYNNISNDEKKLDNINNSLSEYNNKLTSLNKCKDNIIKSNNLKLDIAKLNIDKETYDNNINAQKERIEEINNNYLSFLDKKRANSRLIESFDCERADYIEKLYNRYLNKEKLDNKLKDIQDKLNDSEVELNNTKETLSNLENSRDKVSEVIKRNELLKYKSLVKDGTPCPLCGSINHPNIVNSEEKLEYSIEYLDKEINKSKDRINLLTLSIKGLKDNIDDIRLLDDYKLDINKYDEVKNEAEALESEKIAHYNLIKENKVIDNRLLEMQGAINLAERLKRDNEDRKSGLISNLEKAKALKESLDNEIKDNLNGADINNLINDIKISINKLRGDKATLDSKIKDVRDKYIKLNTSINDKMSRIKALDIEIDKLNLELNNSLLNKNITLKCLEDEINNLPELFNLEARINSFDNERNTIISKISVLEGLITSADIIDLNELRDKLKDLNEEVAHLSNEYIACSNQFNLVNRNILSYNKLIENIKDSLEEYKIIEYMYELCSGKLQGFKKISIQKYVLMKLLDKILAFANHYLKLFSSNRYTLTREESDEKSDKGLELAVNDEHTGYSRSVSSLSGGESFMTALALALGMSECIMQMNGGIKMENIFIDEGFGSLDDEALNNAIEALVTLAEGGRLIGIISHVDSIKALIPQGINVIKGKNGSKIEMNI